MKSLITLAVILGSLSSWAQKTEKVEKEWTLKLQYGFARINYLPTDVNFKSSEINATTRLNVEERTSASFYNPFEKGRKIEEAAHFLHEPSFEYALQLSDEKNSFYMNVLHPKYIKSFFYSSHQNATGLTTYSFADAPESNDFSQAIPEGKKLGYFASTRKNLHISLGYGRNLKIFDSKGFKLTYTPRVDAGVAIGQSRSVRIEPGVAWEDYKDEGSIYHGWLASVGHRVELQKGKLSIFINQRLVYSDIEHKFYDGQVDYKLVYIPTSFGITYQIFKSKKNN